MEPDFQTIDEFTEALDTVLARAKNLDKDEVALTLMAELEERIMPRDDRAVLAGRL